MKNCEFRPITINDIPVMTDLLIGRQNLESKVFPFLKNSCLNVKYIRDELEELLVNSKVIGIGAFLNDELVGYIMGEIKIDDRRGRIIKEKGYGNITTDWRITNLASSTFWPKCGFKPVAYRMVRFIDSNYAWANFNNPSIKQL